MSTIVVKKILIKKNKQQSLPNDPQSAQTEFNKTLEDIMNIFLKSPLTQNTHVIDYLIN